MEAEGKSERRSIRKKDGRRSGGGVGRSWSAVGRAVRVSKRKNEPLKELFGDRGPGRGG